jgi:hypothetical protein
MKMMFLAIALTMASGCAEKSALIKANSTSVHTDIFEELTNAGIAPQGFTDLRITATLKTHLPGIHSGADIHGTPDYKLLLNIDGQAVQIQGSLQEENKDSQGHRDSEAGKGIRYQFNKKLRLRSGTHKMVIALPADDLAEEREITLPEGNNSLVLEPRYRATSIMQRPGFHGQTSFSKGIKGVWVILNGKTI